jgi:hypothetical protein
MKKYLILSCLSGCASPEAMPHQKIAHEIGYWMDTRAHAEAQLYMTALRGDTSLLVVYYDGSKVVKPLRGSPHERGRRYDYKNGHGEYYVLLKSGHLGCFNKDDYQYNTCVAMP